MQAEYGRAMPTSAEDEPQTVLTHGGLPVSVPHSVSESDDPLAGLDRAIALVEEMLASGLPMRTPTSVSPTDPTPPLEA